MHTKNEGQKKLNHATSTPILCRWNCSLFVNRFLLTDAGKSVKIARNQKPIHNTHLSNSNRTNICIQKKYFIDNIVVVRRSNEVSKTKEKINYKKNTFMSHKRWSRAQLITQGFYRQNTQSVEEKKKIVRRHQAYGQEHIRLRYFTGSFVLTRYFSLYVTFVACSFQSFLSFCVCLFLLCLHSHLMVSLLDVWKHPIRLRPHGLFQMQYNICSLSFVWKGNNYTQISSIFSFCVSVNVTLFELLPTCLNSYRFMWITSIL